MSAPRTYGLLAKVSDPASLRKAAEALRDAGYKHFDCHSPFPVHGMDGAMGLKPSKLGFLVFVCGAAGAAGALALQGWTSAIDYPLVISGKPLFSLPAFIPIVFEVTVLMAAFGAVFGMFGLNRLPTWHHPLFESEKFRAVTDDGFFVSVEAADPKFDAKVTRDLLVRAGATSVDLLEER